MFITRHFRHLLLFLLLICFACNMTRRRQEEYLIIEEEQEKKGKSALDKDQIITSQSLGYEVRFEVYLPPKYEEMGDLPCLYVVDGPSYIKDGGMKALLDRLIQSKKIKPIMAVFIDSRDPRYPEKNRRNKEFLGNPAYLTFITDELITRIEDDYPSSPHQQDRAFLGLSFGGLMAAYVGVQASDLFYNIGIQSPSTHPFPEIYEMYEKSERLPIRIFLSTGTKNDTQSDALKFKQILEEKNYPFEYKEVAAGHNWDNWKPLLDDILLFFYARE
ncbi:MAG: alpha/beta hydrolase-fold protein [Bacteroidota bacterium]